MKRKALLVGINDYAPVGKKGRDLEGCLNDVQNVANTFNALGIIPARPDQMHILTDTRATRDNILNELNWLITEAVEGDLLVFYYSGHGSQVLDLFGDEIDWKDETLCPHDFETAGMIKDDDLRHIFSGVSPGVSLEVILDSCHSGTGTRLALALDALPKELSFTVRYIEPPLDYGFFLEKDPTIPTRGILRLFGGAKEAVNVPALNHTLWAACRDNEPAGEAIIDGKKQGVFTHTFCKVLRRAGMETSRKTLCSLVTDYVKTLDFGQHPRLEGTEKSFGKRVFT
ncbi:MAG: caspase family protein [Theionarchaea archaeon]|nr:caspase family protein [Theionarchaea archaeon]